MPPLHQARRSLVDLAVEDIGQRLAAGQWPVDSRIPTEPELAALLGISRNTVREAVRVLLYAGLLEVRQGDGTYVRATTSPAEAMRAISEPPIRIARRRPSQPAHARTVHPDVSNALRSIPRPPPAYVRARGF